MQQRTSLLDQMYLSQANHLSRLPQQTPMDSHYHPSLNRADSNRTRISQSQIYPIQWRPSPSPNAAQLDLCSTGAPTEKKTPVDMPEKSKGLTSMWKHRLQGLGVGLAIALAMTGLSLGLALGLTKPWEDKTTTTLDTSTQSSVTYTCGSLRWSTIGTLVAGGSNWGAAPNQLSNAYGIFVDSNNTLYVADYRNHRIQQWLPNATNGTTVAGTTGVCIQNESGLCYPRTIYVDEQQYIYIADNYGIRRWSIGASSGILYNSSLSSGWILGLDMDKNGNLYACANNPHSILMWSSPTSNPIVVAAGNNWGSSSSMLYYPYGVTVDSTINTLYIVNNQVHTIVAWRINATNGTVVAGRHGIYGTNSYTLRYPQDVKRDTFGNLYIADTNNNRIVMKCASSSDSALKSIIDEGIQNPRSIALDSQLNIYMVDNNGYKVVKYNRLN